MDIDWSKAPEGFPIWVEDLHPDAGCDVSGWACEHDGKLMDMEGSPWRAGGEGVAFKVHRKPKPWTGEGLPPVGLEVEARFPKSILTSWTRFTLMYLSDQVMVYKTISEVACEPAAFELQCVKFRPIRTPEQIAAEEREAKAKAMYLSIYFAESEDGWDSKPENTRETFRKAIDAGWQQVAP